MGWFTERCNASDKKKETEVFQTTSKPVESDTIKPGTLRIVTTKAIPYKFFVEEYKYDYDYKREHEWSSFAVANRYARSTSYDWFPVQKSTKFEGHGYMSHDIQHRTIFYDTEREAERYIDKVIEVARQKAEDDRKLQAFIDSHPPRIYPRSK